MVTACSTLGQRSKLLVMSHNFHPHTRTKGKKLAFRSMQVFSTFRSRPFVCQWLFFFKMLVINCRFFKLHYAWLQYITLSLFSIIRRFITISVECEDFHYVLRLPVKRDSWMELIHRWLCCRSLPSLNDSRPRFHPFISIVMASCKLFQVISWALILAESRTCRAYLKGNLFSLHPLWRHLKLYLWCA